MNAITRVLVLGATGMLGNAVFRVLAQDAGSPVHGTIRTKDAARFFEPALASHLVITADLESNDHLLRLFDSTQPNIVVNCAAVGRPAPTDPMKSISVLSTLPQRLQGYVASAVHA